MKRLSLDSLKEAFDGKLPQELSETLLSHLREAYYEIDTLSKALASATKNRHFTSIRRENTALFILNGLLPSYSVDSREIAIKEAYRLADLFIAEQELYLKELNED